MQLRPVFDQPNIDEKKFLGRLPLAGDRWLLAAVRWMLRFSGKRLAIGSWPTLNGGRQVATNSR